MGATDVVQCLQALDVPSLGLSAGEKKARLRGEIGLAKEEIADGKAGAGGSGEGKGEEGKAAKTPTPADKARTNTENAKKAAEVRRKVLEAKAKREEKAGGKK